MKVFWGSGPSEVSYKLTSMGVIWNEHWASIISSSEIVFVVPSATSGWKRSKKCRYRP